MPEARREHFLGWLEAKARRESDLEVLREIKAFREKGWSVLISMRQP